MRSATATAAATASSLRQTINSVFDIDLCVIKSLEHWTSIPLKNYFNLIRKKIVYSNGSECLCLHLLRLSLLFTKHSICACAISGVIENREPEWENKRIKQNKKQKYSLRWSFRLTSTTIPDDDGGQQQTQRWNSKQTNK